MNLNKLIQQLLILSFFLPSLLLANTIRVPSYYPTILLAVNNSLNGDTIIVSDGEYSYTDNIIISKNIVLISENGPESCIFSDVYLNVRHYLPGQTIIDGFTFTNRSKVSIEGSTKVQNCTFTNIIYDSCNPTFIWIGIEGTSFVDIINCQFSDNSTLCRNYVSDYKGLIKVEASGYSNVNIDGCHFINNSFRYLTGQGGNGGAICVSSQFGNIEISNSNFISNKNLRGRGGAIYSCASNMLIDSCYFYNNTADDGSAIFVENGTTEIFYCTFENNSECAIVNWSDNNSSNTINNSNIINNINGIINLCSSLYFDADSCWWGCFSGPYHPIYNITGLGDTVNLYVDILPFLTSPVTAAPPPLVQSLSIDTIGVDFVILKWCPSPIGDLKGYRLYVNESPTVYEFSDTIDVGNDTVYTLNNLTAGSKYYVSVTCYDNSGDESWFTKTLEVKPSPVSIINTESDQIDFGNVIVGDTVKLAMTVFNTGTADLNISSITTTSSEFISLDTVLTILPNSQKELRIAYLPSDFGFDTVNMAIFSDAYNFPEYKITLIGFGDLSPNPKILSLTDIPDDQGGQVRINFSRSKYDGIDSTYKIVSYTVWRLIENSEWDAIGNFDAIQDSFYHYVAPTLGDSTVHGIVWSTFRVSAHTEDPNIFFYSDSVNGYSIDNIEPGVPDGLIALPSDGSILLTWQSSHERDFQYYGIYRSTQSNFNPDSMEICTYVTSDTFYIDSNIKSETKYYYRISAFDYAGNESDFSLEVNAAVVGIQENLVNIPIQYAISQNFPNPFNPTTTISYQLPKSSFVKLAIYDINGRLIETLVNENKNAGYYSINWNASSVSTGIYIYRIDAGEFTCVKKCLVVK
ncbi:MAG TPA: choice-of-anchor D domain-containing protein [Candidatus Marinimicrobia bacterium]|nr:choice-of-anchor D domain-containing protein [Candidatus Neomarinimicrobiota bacterium]